MDDPDNIEDNFHDYLNGFSENVRDILEKFKFDGHITTMANKGILYIVLKEYITDRGNLHPNEISNLEMGYIFEEIITFYLMMIMIFCRAIMLRRQFMIQPAVREACYLLLRNICTA